MKAQKLFSYKYLQAYSEFSFLWLLYESSTKEHLFDKTVKFGFARKH